MRLVLDTNVAISGLLWRGAPAGLIDAAIDGQVELATSPALLVELKGVLARQKFAGQLAKRGINALALFDGYAALAGLWKPTIVERVIARDPDDDEVLAAAVAARADLIVSGDYDLLDLGSYRDTLIVSAPSALSLCGLDPHK